MQALAIIEPFNERKDLPARVVPRVMRLMMNEFILEGAEEAFRHGIIVAIPFAAHARRDPEWSPADVDTRAVYCAPDPSGESAPAGRAADARPWQAHRG